MKRKGGGVWTLRVSSLSPELESAMGVPVGRVVAFAVEAYMRVAHEGLRDPRERADELAALVLLQLEDALGLPADESE